MERFYNRGKFLLHSCEKILKSFDNASFSTFLLTTQVNTCILIKLILLKRKIQHLK